MSKKNIKPTLDESEYFDEIQAQVTELMGPPPLQTTPMAKNQTDDKAPSKQEDLKTSSKQVEVKPLIVDAPKSTVPKPPEPAQNSKSKKEEPKSKQAQDSEKQDSAKEQDIVADKSITIEQAQELSKQNEQDSYDNNVDKTDADSIYSTKVSSAVEDIESRESKLSDESAKKPATNSKKHKKIPIKKVLLIISLTIFSLILTLMAIPKTRYYILNNFGARASINFSVVDSKTNFPVSGVQVSVQGKTVTTDANGKASANNLKLGKTTINLQKRSFTDTNETIVIGWGSNPITTPFILNPAGNKYSVIIKDWLTNKAIEGATVISADSKVSSNKNGFADIIIAENAPKSVTIQSADYRDEVAVVNINKNTEVSLVPATPNFYIAENDGKYNLEKVDLDGKNRVTVFGGTGSEVIESMSVLPQPSSKKQLAAFVSTRSGAKNSDGYSLSDLYIVEANKKTANKVEGTRSEKIQLIGWDGNRIIFVKTVAGPSAAQAGRQRIISYDTESENSTELAKADGFSDFFVRKNLVYFSNTGPAAKLFSIQTDGNNLKTLLNKEVWSLEELSETSFAANTSDKKWQKINFTTANIEELSNTAVELNLNQLKVYAPTGSKLALLESNTKNGKLTIEKLNQKPVAHNSTQLKNKEYIAWVSDNYLIAKNSSLGTGPSIIINIDSSELSTIE
jgi:hypothetical protein